MAAPVTNPSTTTPYSNASLYVGDLAPDVTEALLFEIFNAVGPVASVRVCRDAATRRSLGYAYVNYHRVEDAERALDTMNFKKIRDRPCRIMWSQRDPSLRRSGSGNIFVKNLAKSIDNKTLCDTFSMFGNILSCKVATNEKGESVGYGFVHYESEDAANNAITKVNGMNIAGQKVSVERFKSKSERHGDKDTFTNLFVKNLPMDFDEAKVKGMFTQFGEVSSFKREVNEKKGAAYAFVDYKSSDAARKAVDELNGKAFGEKNIFVGRFQTRAERDRELRAKFEAQRAERYKAFRGVNLYVKNLADNIDDDRLTQEFTQFGLITSAKVMFDENKSKGFGFVCFKTPEEATKAVTEMNGKMLEGKPLYVALAQRKEDRRQQLEAQYQQRGKFNPQQGPQMYPTQNAPVFYPTMPQRPVMFPGNQMVPGRWQGRVGQPMMGMPPRAINYQLMPIPNARGGQGGPNQRQRGNRRGGKGPQGQGPQGQQVRYNPNVRNQQQTQPQMQQQNVQGPTAATNPANQPLTIKTLAAAPEEQKKQMIGERLFPLIKEMHAELAGKITGMLLEMDNGELIHLLESREALNLKVDEALHVLELHEEDEEEDEEDEEDAQ